MPTVLPVYRVVSSVACWHCSVFDRGMRSLSWKILSLIVKKFSSSWLRLPTTHRSFVCYSSQPLQSSYAVTRALHAAFIYNTFPLYGDEVLTGYQSQESVSTARQDYDSLTTTADLLLLLLGILPRRRIAADGEPRDE